MLFAAAHDERHHAAIEFVEGECFLCGRLLEVELGAAIGGSPGIWRLMGAIEKTWNEWEQAAAALGVSYEEYVEEVVRPRLDSPSCARRRRGFQVETRKPRHGRLAVGPARRRGVASAVRG